MIYSDKVKDFIGKKGQCEPNVSGFSFYLSNSSKVTPQKILIRLPKSGKILL